MQKNVSDKWSSIANVDDVITGWKKAKDRLSLDLDADAWEDFLVDIEDDAAGLKRPFPTEESFDDEISFDFWESIDVDDGSNKEKNNHCQTRST